MRTFDDNVACHDDIHPGPLASVVDLLSAAGEYRKRWIVLATIFALFFCAGAIAYEFYNSNKEREQKLSGATDAVAAQIQAWIDTTDYALVVARNLHHEWLNGTTTNEAVLEKLKETVQAPQGVRALAIMNRNGDRLFSSLFSLQPDQNVANQEQFTFHRNNPNDDIFLTAPFRSDIDGKLISTLSRRLVGANGEFLGIVNASFDPFSLAQFFAVAATAGPESDFGIVHFDGRLMFSIPSYNMEGIDISNLPAVAAALASRTAGSGIWANRATGVMREIRWKPIHKAGVFVYIATPYWPHFIGMLSRTGIYLLVTIVVVVSLWLFQTSMQRRLQESIAYTRTLDEKSKERENLFKRSQSIIDSTIDGLIIIDAAGTIQQFSPSAERIFGYSAHDVVGRNVSMLMPEPYHSAHDSYVRNYVETGQAKVIGIGREVTGRRKNGDSFPLDLAISEMQAVDGNRAFIGTIRDITNRKRTQTMLVEAQKMEAIGRLTGGVAHDFNNMLFIIQGSIQMAMRSLRDDKIAGRLTVALNTIARGTGLVKSLLVFARRSDLNPVVVDLKQMAGELQPMVSAMLRGSIEPVWQIADDVSRISADRVHLDSAIMNVVVNARDAMPKGGRLTMSAKDVRLSGDTALQYDMPVGDYVEICIEDTGTGMDAETVQRVFEPFFTTKELGKGTGLGLAQVYGFMRESGGSVFVNSALGIGTTISLLFPATVDPVIADVAGQTTHVTSRPVSSGTRTPDTRILVVDDQREIRTVIAAWLLDANHDVTTVADGRQALGLLTNGAHYDLLLSDISLPGKFSGFDLARDAKRALPSLKVILMSGLAAEQSGPDPDPNIVRLQKPIAQETLIATIDAAIKGSTETIDG